MPRAEGEPGSIPELVDLLRAEIRSTGPIPFARFMELALYAPGLGYYARESKRTGKQGDYFTAATVGPLFGRCLARQIAEMDEILGRPDPLLYVEPAAGRGYLARDVLDTLAKEHPSTRARTVARLIDRSPAMRAEASARVPEAEALALAVPDARAGAVVAVELFDALPVHRVRRRGAALLEMAVDLDRDARLVEVERLPLPEIATLAARYGAAPEDGYEAEICTAAEPVLRQLAASMGRGYIVIVDYGARAADLYGERRRRGTLLAYRGHATSEDYLAHVGTQDLTAHVNFSLLEDAARAIGLSVLGLTTQDRFLIQNGILDAFDERDPDRWGNPAQVRERLQAKQLIDPAGMGRTFQVLILGKDIDTTQPLRGLADPFR